MAKMKQQRLRRFKSIVLESYEIQQKVRTKEKKVWDRNSITPGTIFMKKLHKDLQKKPSLYDMVPLGRIGRALLKWLLHSKNLEQDLRALEIGRFRLNSGEVHQWAYDRYSLAKDLLDAGFTDPKKCAHGESRIPDWKSFHLEVTLEGAVEKPDLLVMEAIK